MINLPEAVRHVRSGPVCGSGLCSLDQGLPPPAAGWSSRAQGLRPLVALVQLLGPEGHGRGSDLFLVKMDTRGRGDESIEKRGSLLDEEARAPSSLPLLLLTESLSTQT